MDILKKILGVKEVEVVETYICWICEQTYAQPGDFLAHIQDCTKKNKDNDVKALQY